MTDKDVQLGGGVSRVGEFAHKFRVVQKRMKENLPVCAEMDEWEDM